MIGLAASHDENPSPKELSQLQVTVTNLMGKVELLERKLQSFESNSLAAYFQGKYDLATVFINLISRCISIAMYTDN